MSVVVEDDGAPSAARSSKAQRRGELWGIAAGRERAPHRLERGREERRQRSPTGSRRGRANRSTLAPIRQPRTRVRSHPLGVRPSAGGAVDQGRERCGPARGSPSSPLAARRSARTRSTFVRSPGSPSSLSQHIVDSSAHRLHERTRTHSSRQHQAPLVAQPLPLLVRPGELAASPSSRSPPRLRLSPARSTPHARRDGHPRPLPPQGQGRRPRRRREGLPLRAGPDSRAQGAARTSRQEARLERTATVHRQLCAASRPDPRHALPLVRRPLLLLLLLLLLFVQPRHSSPPSS